tara:strand:+ start:228 stop:407 length:180 start_codon:yes stop_codon:yes gene_type:complete
MKKKDSVLQITVRIKDVQTQRFLQDKIEYLKSKGAKNASLQSVIEGLIDQWMKEDERKR